MPKPPTPRPPRDVLARVLAEARRGQLSKRASEAHLQQCLAQWFPRQQWASVYAAAALPDPRGAAGAANPYHRFCRDPPRVSREWATALQLLELARLVDAAPPHAPSPPAPTPARDAAVARTAEHLLRYAVFPPAGWAVTLQLLHEWRAAPQSLASPPAFPPALGPPAAAQLLHHISLAAPSPRAWEEALELYQLCAVQTHRAVDGGAPGSSDASAAPPAAAATTAFLKALRHMTLTTLLQAGEWARALRFYYHTLYQRDLPGSITTAYLVQQLGRAGQWASVLQVYELCVKLLKAQRQRASTPARSSDEAAARQWGTTLSMAMAAAQRSPGASPDVLATMLRQLLPDGDSAVASSARASAPPLVRLDGHFLSAVQALPTEPARLAVLQLAQRGSMLDVFKLIRGLASKQKWEEALLLFEQAMAWAPASPPGASPSPCLSRREVGEARLHLLHGCTLDSVVPVVAALNRHRRPASSPTRGSVATPAQSSVRLRLNDREVECVLSKALTLTGGDGSAPPSPAALARRQSFWQYCLEVLAANYGTTAMVRGPSHAPRRPSPAALSFLLRHPRLPWEVALAVVQRYGLLEVPHAETAEPRRLQPVVAPASPTPRALALAAAVELLRSQGQPAAAERLALHALEVEAAERGPGVRADEAPLSAALLQTVQYRTLCNLLQTRRGGELPVAAPTLFHVLHESTAGGSAARRRAAQNSDAVFFDHPCGRALTVLWLLMLQRRQTEPFAPPAMAAEVPASLFRVAAPPARSANHVTWLLTYPVAIHCEAVRVVQCATTPCGCTSAAEQQAYARRWAWTLRYLGALATHFTELPVSATGVQPEAEAASAAAAARECYYGATFEAVLSLLDSVAPAAGARRSGASALGLTCSGAEDGGVPQTPVQRVERLCELLERAVSRYGCLPPTHMLLPNQLDRLLPPLPHAGAARLEASGAHAVAPAERLDAQAERCAVAFQLVRLVVAALAQRGPRPPVAEPALLNNLLKLCCRLAEYDEASGAVTRVSREDVSGELSRDGVSLMRLQCEQCGLHTVRPGTLSLLYCLCAAAQSRATHNGHGAPRQAALEATRYLLQRQSPTTPRVVLARHCRQYLSLFGWEGALETWYSAFPHEVFSELAHIPQAVEACLSLGEKDAR